VSVLEEVIRLKHCTLDVCYSLICASVSNELCKDGRYCASVVLCVALHKIKLQNCFRPHPQQNQPVDAVKEFLKSSIDPVDMKIGIRIFKGLKDGKIPRTILRH
jgi:hypothetical protein